MMALATWMDWRIGALGMLFYFLENNYFGWNAVPTSGIEVVCDGISLLIFALAFTSGVKRND